MVDGGNALNLNRWADGEMVRFSVRINVCNIGCASEFSDNIN